MSSQHPNEAGLPNVAAGEEVEDNAAAFTCRFTAGLRHVEGHRCSNPLLQDGLAAQLAGPKARALAEKELADLIAAQGPGKHLRVPARTRILDDDLLMVLGRLSDPSGSKAARGALACNVVALGAGMDTRPWRLSFPASLHVHWCDCDFPVIIRVKSRLLAAAGAQTCKPEYAQHMPGTVSPPLSAAAVPADSASATAAGSASSASDSTDNTKHRALSLSAETMQSGSQAAPSSASQPVETAYALGTSSWTAVASDLSVGDLAAQLSSCGFDGSLPTVWVAEAVLYYMTAPQATAVLHSAATISAPGSSLLATCVDTELLEASRNLQAGHVFANLWHFDMNDMAGEEGMLAKAGWVIVDPPETSKELAWKRYGADTYVAAYGGAECVFSAKLQSDVGS